MEALSCLAKTSGGGEQGSEAIVKVRVD